MWLKALNPKRVYPQLIHQEINPLPPYEVNIENRLMLLGLDDMTVRLEKLDAIRKRVEKNKVPVQNSNSFAE